MPGPPRPSDPTLAGHDRALASPTRVQVLEVVRQHPEGIDAGRIAAAVGFHVNTVRAHLEILEHVGLVRSAREERHHRGRPRRLFRAVDASVDASADDRDAGDPRNAPKVQGHDDRREDDGQEAYRTLAAALAAAVHDPSPDRTGAVAAAGSRWGEELAAEATGGDTASGSRVVPAIRNRLIELLDGLGFAPSLVGPDRIELRRCPFLDVVREHPEVVCGLHRGILAGALEALGHDGAVELDPFTTPTTCEVRFGDVAGSAA